MQEQIETKFNSLCVLRDVILLNGGQAAEEKFYWINVFTGHKDCGLDPAIVVGTAGVLGCGINDPSMYEVIFCGWPASILDAIQALG